MAETLKELREAAEELERQQRLAAQLRATQAQQRGEVETAPYTREEMPGTPLEPSNEHTAGEPLLAPIEQEEHLPTITPYNMSGPQAEPTPAPTPVQSQSMMGLRGGTADAGGYIRDPAQEAKSYTSKNQFGFDPPYIPEAVNSDTSTDVLTSKLRKMTPDITGRPSIEDLYNRLGTLQGKPLDFSGVEAASAGRIAAARRDMIAGMALASRGGEKFSPMGGGIFQKALADMEPIRPNLADVGYIDPTTGKFTENPMVARSREEKVIAGRIDALVKEREHNVNQLLAEGKFEEAKAMNESLRALREAQANIGERKATVAEQAEQRKKATSGKAKPVPGLQTPDQGPVYIDPDTRGYVDADGQPTKPYSTAEVAKGVTASTEATVKGSSLDQVMKDLDNPDNEKAFGPHMGIITKVPYGEGAYLSKEQGALRAQIGEQAGQMRHAISGAAVTLGEQPFLAPYIIDVNHDTASVIKWKMQNLIRINDQMQAKLKARGFSESGGKPAAPAAAPSGYQGRLKVEEVK